MKSLKRQTLHNESWMTVSTSHDLDSERGSSEDVKSLSTAADRACDPLVPGSKHVSVNDFSSGETDSSGHTLLALRSGIFFEDRRCASSFDGRPFEAPWFENSARNLGQWMKQDPLNSSSFEETSCSMRGLRTSEIRQAEKYWESRRLPSALRSAGRSLSDNSPRRRRSSRAADKLIGSLFHHERKDDAGDSSRLIHDLSPPHSNWKDVEREEKTSSPRANMKTSAASVSRAPGNVEMSASGTPSSAEKKKKKKKRGSSTWIAACFEH